MTADEIEQFLTTTRQAILLRTNDDGTAAGAPVWFDWDGATIRFFSSAAAPKVRGIERDPRISVLVVNDISEPPAWVRFDGTAVVDRDVDARPFAADELAPRYWDLSVPDYTEMVEQWRDAPKEALVMIRLDPDRIASS